MNPFGKISSKEKPIDDEKQSKFNIKSIVPEVTGINRNVLIGLVILFVGVGIYGVYSASNNTTHKAEIKDSKSKLLAANEGRFKKDGDPDDYEELGQFEEEKKKKANKVNQSQSNQSRQDHQALPSRDSSYMYTTGRNNNPIIRGGGTTVPATIPLPDKPTYTSSLKFGLSQAPAAQDYSTSDVQTTGNGSGSSNQSTNLTFRKTVSANKDFYNPASITEPLSPYEVKAGTIIASTLITGINSDLPGIMIAQINENIFDSVSGRYLLLPQGTKLIGQYNSKTTYGQDRVQVVWTRLIMPNGDSFDLNGALGADLSGYSGIEGRVNNHDNKLINGALATSAFSVLVSKQTNSSSSSDSDPASVVAQNMSQIANKIIDRSISIQPTIEVEPGTQFAILVDQDLVLRPYQSF